MNATSQRPGMGEILETAKIEATEAGIADAARRLAAGQLVAFPTETVYGLGADATDDTAVARIFEAKNRPSFNPLIAHVADLDSAERLCTFSETARQLADAFWPGALTLVLPLKSGSNVSKLVTAGGDLLALRMPVHPIARTLLRTAGIPIAAPSANPSGRISPTNADHVAAGLAGRIDAILDGGACAVGLESTIIGFDPGPTLLRAGGIPIEAIEDCLGARLLRAQSDAKPSAPGQLASHYAPAASVRLNALAAKNDECLIGFGSVKGDMTLSENGDLREAATKLFSVLHRADATRKPIAVAPIPDIGLGRAINDRLTRAAAPRP